LEKQLKDDELGGVWSEFVSLKNIDALMKKLFPFIVVVAVGLFVLSCGKETTQSPADFVNPFIGTGGHGHTFPGATAPFGGVQLSPDTRKDSWDGCSGYHYSDSVIFGFSHTHLSGTGVGDYGDIRLMPTVGEINYAPGTADNPDTGYASRFSHQNEKASPGYYQVLLDDYGIKVELTTTPHAGMHRYYFPRTDQARVVLVLVESVVTEKILGAELRITSDHEVMGCRITKGWAAEQKVYFYASFSRPFQATGLLNEGVFHQNKLEALGDDLKAVFTFNMLDGGPLLVKVGISPIDYHSARENCFQEIDSWDFEGTHEKTRESWNKQLSKIEVEGDSHDDKTVFYTALYHTMIAPNIFSDVDGRYRNHADEVIQDRSFKVYTVFSLWDTFRTLHPLFTLIERERSADMINSMLDMYKHDGLLPVWELAGNETNCMIGYHAVPVIADAWMKGIRGFDADLALKAMKASARSGLFGLNEYMTKGYIPADKEGESVSKTLEYAYDDWCIAQVAKGLNDVEAYQDFSRRAQYYKNLFDKSTGFFRGKSNGGFVVPFDPTQVNFMLTEANTWQYNFFVPQDINTHIDMLGGDVAYEQKLDELFTTAEKLTGRVQSDITGLIGQYAHGNEPSHHMAYLYNFVGKPWKTQQLVHRICSELYSNNPDGLSGNEDCGQMSAWYVMSALGFYPVTPASMNYVLGSPRFDVARINLENGKVFVVKASGISEKNRYIRSVKYNGQSYTKSYITYDMISNGGELEIEMDDQPNEAWGQKPEDRPVQRISDFQITAVPAFQAESRTFETTMTVGLVSIDSLAKIKVTHNGTSSLYEQPIEISRTSDFMAMASVNGITSFAETANYLRIPANRRVIIHTPYSDQYTAGGDIALINTIRGGHEFRTGNWQGYYGTDLDVVVDLGELQLVSEVGAGFLQDENSWIFMPEKVRFQVSADGVKYQEAGLVYNPVDQKESGGIVHDFVVKGIDKKIRFIHVTATSSGACPDWHVGAGNPSWIFADEIWTR
jgi:predicted alpha-1,2-mannosidase